MQKPSSSTPPLTYVKLILAKVSFDAVIFQRELRKAVNVLLPHELSNLEQWCYRRFGNVYGALLDECFGHPQMGLA
ncbi:MAG: hypothetical protein WA960_10140 [Tunicatimonas sp.]